MCGIVGYAGRKNVIKNIMTGLKSLEYRGYDSAGIAYIADNKINILKKAGPIKNLDSILDYSSPASVGISHTRWATHGKADDTNAHPHKQGKITLVHNGIIENYDIKRITSFKDICHLTKCFYHIFCFIINIIYLGCCHLSICFSFKCISFIF